VIRLDRQAGWGRLRPGTYRWRFTYDGRAVSSRNLSYQDRTANRPTVATTILDPDQPPRDTATFDPGGRITMGVDQF
jgi:hypothetical protein